MTSENIELTRKEYNLIAKKRGIQKSENMSTAEFLNTLSRYDSKHKVRSNRRRLLKRKLQKIAKIQNIPKKD